MFKTSAKFPASYRIELLLPPNSLPAEIYFSSTYIDKTCDILYNVIMFKDNIREATLFTGWGGRVAPGGAKNFGRVAKGGRKTLDAS